MRLFRLAPLAVIALAIGCTPSPEEDSVPESKPVEPVAFTGEIQPEWAGTWKTTDGRSTMILGKDGAMSTSALVFSRGGPQKSEEKGEWRIDGDSIVLKSTSGNTSKYFYTKKGADLFELRQLKDSKIKTTYARAK